LHVSWFFSKIFTPLLKFCHATLGGGGAPPRLRTIVPREFEVDPRPLFSPRAPHDSAGQKVFAAAAESRNRARDKVAYLRLKEISAVFNNKRDRSGVLNVYDGGYIIKMIFYFTIRNAPLYLTVTGNFD